MPWLVMVWLRLAVNATNGRLFGPLNSWPSDPLNTLYAEPRRLIRVGVVESLLATGTIICLPCRLARPEERTAAPAHTRHGQPVLLACSSPIRPSANRSVACLLLCMGQAGSVSGRYEVSPDFGPG